MADDPSATIVIKKIKKGGHGHHGGAWKVAYADFVTAMMAFFLLLWLLASTSEETKEGIAEYFTPTIGIRDSKGIGVDGGLSQSEDGSSRSEMSQAGVVAGNIKQGETSEVPEKAVVEGTDDANMFEKGGEELEQAISSDPTLKDFSENISVQQTPEGLKIQIQDTDDKAMFEPGSANLSATGQKVIKALAPLINKMPNRISISGHTDSTPYSGKMGYTNWELSSDRANSARNLLQANNIGATRVAKVVGMADQDLLTTENPASPKNRRIDITLLKGTGGPAQPGSRVAPNSLLSVPNPGDTLRKRQMNEIEKQEQGTTAPSPFKSGGGVNLMQ
jgi:chemotaxis protein MotB